MSKSIVLTKGTCDVIKLIAALLVVTSHIGSTALGTYGSTHTAFYALASQNGYIGVAAFFFLSGYGLMESETKSRLSIADFLKKRLFKVYFPVLLVTGVWTIITPPYLTAYKSTIYVLLWDFADPVMWFIRVLIPLYIAFYLCGFVAQSIGWKKSVAIFLIFSIAWTLYRAVEYDSIRDHSVPMFGLGMICSKFKSKGVGKLSGILLLVGVIVGVSAFFTSHPLTNALHCIFDYLIVALLLYFTAIFRPDWRLTPWLTAILFDIYLIHFKFFIIVSEVWHWPLWLFLLLALPGSIGIAYIFMFLRTSLSKILHIY